MQTSTCGARRWAALAMAFLLSACGGGGSDGPPPPPPDARNGSYAVFAANAQRYTLTLDYDAKTWRMAGAGIDQSGTIGTVDGTTSFQGTSVGTGVNTARFHWVQETVIGGFRFGDGVIPFVAPRRFATSVAEVVGSYHFLTSVVDPAAPSNSLIFTGEITSDGKLRTCGDSTIFVIQLCPPGSIFIADLTVNGEDFSATSSAGTFLFRVARIGGGDRVFVRASASSGTSRRFTVGVPAQPGYSRGRFTGANSLGQWVATTMGPSSFTTTAVQPNGATVERGGTLAQLSGNSPGGMVGMTDPALGHFFSIRSVYLNVTVSARNNPNVPGYVEIGKPD